MKWDDIKTLSEPPPLKPPGPAWAAGCAGGAPAAAGAEADFGTGAAAGGAGVELPQAARREASVAPAAPAIVPAMNRRRVSRWRGCPRCAGCLNEKPGLGF